MFSITNPLCLQRHQTIHVLLNYNSLSLLLLQDVPMAMEDERKSHGQD
jgi:hypothetical protein